MSRFASSTGPTVQGYLFAVDQLFEQIGGTKKEMITPPQREVIMPLVVDESNYRELALAEIARQNTTFGTQFEGNVIPLTKQAAIVTAFQQLAGVQSAAVRPDQLALLKTNQQKLSLKGQTDEFIKRANDFAATTVDAAGNIFEFVTSPFGLLTIGAATVVTAVLLVR
jgi:hypothetical protein